MVDCVGGFQALTAAAAPLKLLVNAAGVNHDALLARLNADKMENMVRGVD